MDASSSKRRKQYPHIEFIVMTGYGTRENSRRSHAARRRTLTQKRWTTMS